MRRLICALTGKSIDGVAGDLAEVEIVNCNRKDEEVSNVSLVSDPRGVYRFYSRLEDLNVDAPEASVAIIGGISGESVLVAPITIIAKEILLETDRVVAMPSRRSSDLGIESSGDDVNRYVYLETENIEGSPLKFRPTCYGEVKLEVCGSDFGAHPWTEFSIARPTVPSTKMLEASRHLSKIMRLFSRGGRGEFTKYRKAIDGRRRTKGSGQIVLDQLLDEGVLRIDGSRYRLDLVRLRDSVGLSLLEARAGKITPGARDFLQRALNRS